MEKYYHKSNYILEFKPFKLGSSDKWCPKVLIKDLGANKTVPLIWDIALSSRESANLFANEQINEYIKKNLEI